MQIMQNRRHFLTSAAAAGLAGIVGPVTGARAEVPETTSVRLPKYVDGAYCWAGLYMAGEILRAEGFTDVRICAR